MVPKQIPTQRSERWRLLEEFISVWFGTAKAQPGVEEPELNAAEERLGVSLPVAFREWYLLNAARTDVWSTQDRLWLPNELRLDGEVLPFCIENQGVVRWGIRLGDVGLDDPPVVVSDMMGSGEWFVENDSTSGFALQFAIVNAKWTDTVAHAVNGQLTDAALRAVEREYVRLPFPDMHWPAVPCRLYGRDDTILETHGDTWLWAKCLTSGALAEVKMLAEQNGMEWEYSSEM